MSDYWTPLRPSALAALRRARDHVDGMTVTGTSTARLLVKCGLAESYGRTVICISEKGLRMLEELEKAERKMNRVLRPRNSPKEAP